MTALSRRTFLAGAAATGALFRPSAAQQAEPFAAALEEAASLEQLNALIIAREGEEVAARVFDGPGLDTPVNIKSASKSVLSALAGIAIAQGEVPGVEARLLPLLADRAPADIEPRTSEITLEDLLTMRAGLASTSGREYGPWVVSDDWTAYALRRPFVAEPGGRMIYSTGTSHLLAAALTEATGRSLLALARDWLGEPLGIEVPPWTRAPEGVYMGGNNMALSPRGLLAFGEVYRRGGIYGGQRVLREDWIEASWTPRVRSPWSGGAYGYGWWIGSAGGHRIYYAWGYGGQMVYVIPDLGLTVVMTSDPNARGVDGHVQALHRLVARRIVPAV
ncbi:serine hydrolase domain-containing protein [Parvularcula oceani]|uniref:serine hydrolase domain-containing protein n=1 Tax=Parvularcula oceani TaxID=1247963 RepID=UPI0004E22FF5|nr:serine hydrolase [Parvularcula oceani]